MADVKTDVPAWSATAEPDAQVGWRPGTVTCDTPASDVQAFISENRLETWLEVTFRLIARHFSPICGVTLQKKEDPELPDEWVGVRVIAGGDLDSLLDAYDAFTLDMVSAMPPEAGRKIRLSLGVG